MAELAAFCEAADKSFGPTLPTVCRGGFDFTLSFEQSILSILPCGLFLLISVIRLGRLSRSPPVAESDINHTAKLVAAIFYAVLRLTSSVLWTLNSALRTRLSIPYTVLSLLSAFGVAIVSHFEHTKSVRPSTLLAVFLTSTLLFDVAITRTLWLLVPGAQLLALFTASTAVKAVLLVLEAREKTPLPTCGPGPSPESLSSLYSRSFFWWINPLFLKGFRKIIALHDLDRLEDELASERLCRRMTLAWKTMNHERRWALFAALCLALKQPLLVPVPARLALIAFNYAQPFIITAAVSYVQGTTHDQTKAVGYGLIGATFIIYIGIAIFTAQYNYKLYRAITMIRGSLVGIIYDKTLRLPSATAKSSASLTLISSDVDRIALTAETAYEIWAGALEIGVAVYLLQRQLGWACVATVILAAVSLGGNSAIGKLIPSRLRKWQEAVQTRVSATSSALRNIRSVKMMGLAPETADFLQDARNHELDCSARFRWFVAFMNLFGALPRLFSAPFTFLIFVFSAQFFTENGLSASRAFTTLSLLELLTNPLEKVLKGIPVFTATFGCLDRIQEYLLLGGQADARLFAHGDKLPFPGTQSTPSVPKPTSLDSEPEADEEIMKAQTRAVAVSEVTVKYGNTPVLKNISFDVDDGELVMIIGPVGCGKSTLLKALVGDISPASGSVRLKHPEIAYCQQTPWLTNNSVRNNIASAGGDEDEDDIWYKTVRAACALDEDVTNWPCGDDTVVGSSGLMCSGGQKQRLALARAVYARKPLLVLDDVLSALDAPTERFVFDSLFSVEGLLKRLGATVILVTNATHHLLAADKIVVLDADGRICSQGSYNDLKQSQELAQIQEIIAQVPYPNRIDPRTGNQTAPRGVPKPKVTQVTISQKEKARKTGDSTCYSVYIRSMGLIRAVFFVAIAALFAFCSRFSQVWLQWFTDSFTIDRGLFIGIYFVFAFCAAFSLVSFWWMMIIIIPISAGSLHQQLVTAVFQAPLQFFSSVDVGVILNRFSQDMQFATAQLPISTMNAVTTILVCIGQFALISTGSGYLAATVPALFAVIWCLQKFYLSTSRQLRLLDLEHKSPLYTSLTETIDGLATIRAFGWTATLERLFLSRLDDSQRPVYFLYCIQRWLNLVLDLIVTALAVLLIALASQLRQGGPNNGAAFLGIAMVSIVGFSQSLGQFIFYYTELETFLGAIARINEYHTEIRSEDQSTQSNGQHSPDNWPTKGHIRLDGVSARYDVGDELVLHNVSLDIPAGQLVGIYGRTGSGKSSLVLTLLRLLNLSSGVITIDGVDISTLPCNLLRSKITTVPQEPYFPPHRTIRLSLDGIDGRHTDMELIGALENVGLLPHVTSHLAPTGSDGCATGNSKEKGWSNDGDINNSCGLDLQTMARVLGAKIAKLPLSTGQLQLFCLAHALLREQSNIVLLDEVTSAMDYATEERLRTLFRDGMRGRTVLMIAHRPEMLKLCDMIVQMEEGRVIGVQHQQHYVPVDDTTCGTP